MTRTQQIKTQADLCCEDNQDYRNGFFDGAHWADRHPAGVYVPFVSAEQFLKDNTAEDTGNEPYKRQYFLMYCDDKARIISLDHKGRCYTEVQFMESHREPIDLSKMNISFYLKIPAIR